MGQYVEESGLAGCLIAMFVIIIFLVFMYYIEISECKNIYGLSVPWSCTYEKTPSRYAELPSCVNRSMQLAYGEKGIPLQCTDLNGEFIDPTVKANCDFFHQLRSDNYSTGQACVLDGEFCTSDGNDLCISECQGTQADKCPTVASSGCTGVYYAIGVPYDGRNCQLSDASQCLVLHIVTVFHNYFYNECSIFFGYF